jgi:hypothetical protein
MCWKLADCYTDAAAWCASRRLQLNSDKADVIWFAWLANLRRIASHELSVNSDSHAVHPSRSVRDLGVQLDDELSMVQHVSSITRICFTFVVFDKFDATSARTLLLNWC